MLVTEFDMLKLNVFADENLIFEHTLPVASFFVLLNLDAHH